MSKKIVTIILARIGSKRLTNKVLRILKGKHLIEWTILDALKLNYPIYVYTDSKKVKDICKKYKVNVRKKLFESKEGIHKTAEEIKEYNKELKADIFIMLQPTSPFRNIKILKEYLAKFIMLDYDSAFSAYPITNGYYYDTYGKEINYNKENRTYNGSIKNIMYKETGSFYFFKKEMLNESHLLNTDNKLLCIDVFNIDIDTIEELRSAEKCKLK